MRTKFSGILTLLLAFVVQLTFAQEKTISGSVTDNTGLPLPGVNIVVKGTSNGTQTDFDGNYSIQTAIGQTLVYSYVGFTTIERPVTAATNSISVQLQEDAAVLEEVVVTASGIKKEKKALGYAVSSVKEEAIKDNPETDLTRILSGKSAGIDITTQNGLSGSANKVIIRGMNSFSGDNNALYVIDGVPYSNDTNAAGSFVDGNMGTSRSFDIDPSNIENIDILKGLAATTLYGTEGRNGVILITTKTGSSKNLASKQEVELSSSYFFNEVASLPDYQNKYGGGFDQAYGLFYSNWGPGFYKDGVGGWGAFVDDTNTDVNKPYNSDGTLPHPYSTSAYLASNFPDFQAQFEGLRYKWEPQNSVERFFKTGTVASFAANIRGRSEDNKYNYGMSFAHVSDEGFTPGNEVDRSNLTVSGGAQLSNKINVRGSLNYTLTNLKTPPVSASFGSSIFGSGSSVFGDLLYTPRSIDFFSLPFEAPDGSSIYYRDDNAIQHPLWTVKNSRFAQKVNRVNGFGAIDFNITDNLNLSYQASVDTYSEDNINRQNKGGVTGVALTDSGFYSTYNNANTIFDHKVVLSGSNYSMLNDNLTIDFLAGATSRSTDYNRIGVTSYGQQVFDFFDHGGFSSSNPIEFHQKRNILGLYGQVGFDIKRFFYVNFAGRNDWVSNAVNNSLFYPSASVSFIPTSAFPGLKSDGGINYLKLRAGYGTSANFSTGYPTVTNVVLNAQSWLDSNNNFITSNTTNSTIGNTNIKPELFSELEFGVEANLFQRVRLDFSYYTRTTNDLIIQDQKIALSTGASTTDTNIGEIKSDGIEVDLGIDIIKSDGFNWNFNVNFTKSESEVTDLGQDTELIIYEGFTNLGNGARVGYPLGSMFGARIARDENGNLLVDGAGNYLSEDIDEDGLLPFIGDPNPDFIMNYSNTFSYKGLSLNVAVGHTSGGDMYSVTIASLMGRGLTTDTEDRLSTYILPGVNSTTGLPNTVQINNSNFYFDNGFASPADELSIYDASVVRLREVSLGYSLPSKLLEKTPFGKIVIKASGYNLWYDAYNTPEGINFDPNVSGLGAGNGQGFEFLTGPSSKRYGFSVNATF
ncbi:TonB-linked SusC/RagA family outer membrane protein [Ulvibacter sp. MAR_2010_11]|uniref:SusC/RagA family TonB-linked outer membrane protein n=1 Tax=Ulvibacter sp. MAR_2010_11 TaxID=1250229 RepID=UPI000C2B84A9|nr:SusC/RagA family TonB-linked outer membrane protein [Ulvibacter sp. MAR_2010_11]PKA83465.1 TonB-linked SusC/RagA family outer membrane protein [Ulvibacter sp. MAR_2010_11]